MGRFPALSTKSWSFSFVHKKFITFNAWISFRHYLSLVCIRVRECNAKVFDSSCLISCSLLKRRCKIYIILGFELHILPSHLVHFPRTAGNVEEFTSSNLKHKVFFCFFQNFRPCASALCPYVAPTHATSCYNPPTNHPLPPPDTPSTDLTLIFKFGTERSQCGLKGVVCGSDLHVKCS